MPNLRSRFFFFGDSARRSADGSETKIPGACFSKVSIINGSGKLSPFSLKIEVSIVLHVT